MYAYFFSFFLVFGRNKSRIILGYPLLTTRSTVSEGTVTTERARGGGGVEREGERGGKRGRERGERGGRERERGGGREREREGGREREREEEGEGDRVSEIETDRQRQRDWILTSSQPGRVTSGRITHSNLFYTSSKHKSLHRKFV